MKVIRYGEWAWPDCIHGTVILAILVCANMPEDRGVQGGGRYILTQSLKVSIINSMVLSAICE